MAAVSPVAHAWLRRKLSTFRFDRRSQRTSMTEPDVADLPFPITSEPLFDNPFNVADLGVFDDDTLADRLGPHADIAARDLGRCADAMPADLRRRVRAVLTRPRGLTFEIWRRLPTSVHTRAAAGQRVLDALFWDLTYWKTPNLYELLTEGELLHPGIFRRLAPWVRDAVVLDAGVGSGRASVECLHFGAREVIALEPSNGLLHLLQRKMQTPRTAGRILPMRGRFDAIPLADGSVDLSIACSAFTADPGSGGNAGLAELKRVTRPGGRVVVIWPRVEDYDWLAAQGFCYEPMPLEREMTVRFRSFDAALRCARLFYARRPAVLAYLRRHRRAEVPYRVLGFNPPHDYCWLSV